MFTSEFSTLTYILSFCLLGGVLSVSLAALFALNLRTTWIHMLVSYAIGAMLGAVFLEILPHAFAEAGSVESVSVTLLFGLLLFFMLEKLVIWRHCHGNHCEVHAIHTEENCPQETKPHNTHAAHHHNDRSGIMIIIGDTFHNFVDGILIASAFMVDIKLGMVTALAIISHEIPQEVGDFLILLHSGYSKKQAFIFNLISSLSTLLGGMIAYFALQSVTHWIPFILSLAAASMLYVAVADLIPGLHKRTELKATMHQALLISLGVGTIWLVRHFIH